MKRLPRFELKDANMLANNLQERITQFEDGLISLEEFLRLTNNLTFEAVNLRKLYLVMCISELVGESITLDEA